MKKPASSVRFYKQKTEKTEPNRNRQKTRKTEPNRKNRAKQSQNRVNRAKTVKTEPKQFEPVFALKKQTEPKLVGLTRFRFFKKKNFGLVTFFDKNRTEPKMITPRKHFHRN